MSEMTTEQRLEIYAEIGKSKRWGYDAMGMIRPKFRIGKMPAWFSKPARAALKERFFADRPLPRESQLFNNLSWLIGGRSLFDHGGMIGSGDTAVVIAQPYEEHDDAAKEIAAILGCELFIGGKVAPWYYGHAFYYEFRKRAS